MSDQRIQYDEEMVGANHPTKSDTLNRLALVEHAQDGNHTVISLDEQSAAPGNEADHGKVYAKEVSGVTELFYLDSAGNEIQLTDGGSMAGNTTVLRGTFTITAQNSVTQTVTRTGAISLAGVTSLSQIKRFSTSPSGSDYYNQYTDGTDVWAGPKRIWLSDYDEVSVDLIENTGWSGGAKTFSYEAEVEV